MSSNEHPSFCDGCPALASICKGITADVAEVTADPRNKRRRGDVKRVAILFALITKSDNPEKRAGERLRIPIKLGMRENIENVLFKIEKCTKFQKEAESKGFCPAINPITSRNQKSNREVFF